MQSYIGPRAFCAIRLSVAMALDSDTAPSATSRLMENRLSKS